MEKIKWSDKFNNEVPERIGENRTLLNNTLPRKPNWISHILRATGGKKMETKVYQSNIR